MTTRPLPAGLDLCVKCGACLPHCASHAVRRDEADSPRGRVALVQGLLRGALPADARLAAHLEACLGCRACEPVCPAGVPVVDLVDAGRAALHDAGLPTPWRVRVLRAAASRPWLARTLAALTWCAQRTGITVLLQRLLPGERTLGLARALPPVRVSRPAATDRGGLRLFAGCLAPHSDAATLDAAHRVYNQLGLEFAVVTQPGCCGALHAHGGLPEHPCVTAVEALAADPRPLLGTATGCSAQLARALPGIAYDLVSDLAARDFVAQPGPALRVAVHAPCTQRHALAAADATPRLLARLPGITVVRPALPGCCGMGGAQGLVVPGQAEALARTAAEALVAAAPDLIVSANWACALQLRSGLRALGSQLEVVHPVVLVARRLGAPERSPAGL